MCEYQREKRWIKMGWISKRYSGIWIIKEIMELQPYEELLRQQWLFHKKWFKIYVGLISKTNFSKCVGSHF